MTNKLHKIRNQFTLLKLGRLIKRLRLSKFILLFYPLLLKLERKKSNIENALEKLNTIYPDKGGSPICSGNHIDPIYDIQVIMPVYNTASTLEKAIDSVLNQKGSLRILLTIINDGSPDNSQEILNKYASLKNIEIINQDNRGLSGARNTGLENIKGKFISFLDSDDWLPDDALEYMFIAAERNGSVIVQGSYFIVTNNNKRLHLVKDKPTSGDVSGFPWGKLFKAELFSNICFPERYWFEDTLIKELILPRADRNKITSISSPTYNYLVNPKGITANAKKSLKILDTLWVSKKIWESRQILGCKFKKDEYASFLRQNIMNIHRIETYGDGDITELAFFAVKELKNRFFQIYEIPSPEYRWLDKALENNKIKNFIFIAGMLK